jgi:hypothetical protein
MAQGSVRSELIVLASPGLDRLLGIRDTQKPRRVIT